MPQIFWIKPAGKPLPSQINSFIESLRKLHVTVDFIGIAQNELSSEASLSVNSSALKGAQALFISGFRNSLLPEILRVVKKGMGGSKGSVPICWLGSEATGVSIDDLVNLGFDDFVWSGESATVVLERLKLRESQIQNQLKLEKMMQEQSAKNAEALTSISQREEFLSVCAHDLRSPLGLIQSSLSLVLNSSDSNLTEIQKELIHRARRQAGDAINLVRDLLDVMSFEQGFKAQYQLIYLDNLLRPFFQDYQFQAQQKGIHFHYNNSLVDWRVLADSDRIRQLMQNLVVNAIKFTEQGKNIYLNVKQFQGRRKSDPPYPMLIVSIKDEGKGIPQKELQKIFDRFTQLKEQSRNEGRGLGLTVAKQISTLHDGNLWVESEEGRGSTFFVLFPHVVSRTMAPDFEVNPTELKKILVVESSTKKRELYFETFKRWGYELIFGNDGIEAVTLCFHCLPQLVILNEGLSKMSESQVADTLKSDPLTAKVKVVIAGNAEKKFDVESEEFPFDGVLKTPFTREEFEDMVRKLGATPLSTTKKVA